MADEKRPFFDDEKAQLRPAMAPPARKRQKERMSRLEFTFLFVLPLLGIIGLVGVALSLPLLLQLPEAMGIAKHVSGHSALQLQGALSREELKAILLSTPSNDSAAEWLRYYTAGPHLAGQNYSQAAWTRDRWEEWGAAAHITAYDLYLNTPVDHSLSLLTAPEGSSISSISSSSLDDWTVTFRASLEEDVLPEDATTGLDDRVPTFHGYSASGNVTGPVVYVNYGTYQDYADVEAAGISLAGTVVIARYGGIFRGLKVKRAQELGAVGVLLYSDPGDDNGVTEENGYATYPEGPARQPSSVQRGSVEFLSVAPGDPTTPGYPSKPGVPRGPTERYIPQIPSIPISYADALPILKALNGHGPAAKTLGPAWTEHLGLGGQGVQYHVGPTPANQTQVNLYNEQAYTTTPIWNTIGIFNGSTLPNEVVVVGNHRDAWIAGGAVDPNSGSAVLNEVVRAFGAAAARGWKPLRTVVFASWDGEEYGLLGSTEWVEEYLPWLQDASLAYVNIDTGVSGPHFGAAAVPLLHDLIHTVAGEVPSPNQTVAGQTVADTWTGHIGPLGSGSDYTAFLDHAGVASLDVRFSGGGHGDPVYHYHSNYDSYHWMATYGDPEFIYHVTSAQVLGLLTAHLATDVVAPFRAGDYAAALQTYVDAIRAQLEAHGQAVAWAALSEDDKTANRGRKMETAAEATETSVVGKARVRLALDRLDAAVAQLSGPAAALDAKADELRAETEDWETISGGLSWWRRLLEAAHRLWVAVQVLGVNRKYQHLEKRFLHADGLDGREWFKHVVFAPGLWTGYAGAVFPGLVESIDAGNWTNAVRWADIIEERIAGAAKGLEH